MERATAWSITINNPEDGETTCRRPGWTLEGQFEQGENGTRHFQGLLKTDQQRFSAIKKVFPRAHIEIARNVAALQQYVHKDETRIETFHTQTTPNIFQFQKIIADKWDANEWHNRLTDPGNSGINARDPNDLALTYVDLLCSREIASGTPGLEFVAVNPMWRSSWKRFWSSIITRNARPPPLSSTPSPPEGESPPSEE